LFEFGNHGIQGGFGIAKEHPGIVLEEDVVFDAGKAGAMERLSTSTVLARSASMMGMP